ncbi:C40 family peptidase [Gardnerella sp. DNF00753]|uniref:C40 family peptidase n=1 Tax=unclassified Gardnerella TaxID=2628112 RepID=UPI003BAB297E
MLNHSKIFSVIASAVTAASMLAVMAPIAMADSSHASEQAAVTSTRSFPKMSSVRRDLLTESTSTDVDSNSHWGGIESLNVPQTKTPSELAAAAARNAYEAAASRSEYRGGVQPVQQANIVPPNGKSVEALLNFATQFLGKVPYRSGGTTPAGWDCSGFVQYVFAAVGVSLPRTSGAQATVGTPIPSLDQAQPGDIIANGQHASIYVGNGMVINSQLAGTKYDPIRYVFTGGYSIRRVL